MEIIGVFHDKKYLNDIEKYLQENYPCGIKSLLVELPAVPKEVLEYVNSLGPDVKLDISDSFFTPIANKYKNQGTRIINGDINRKILGRGKNLYEFIISLKELFGKDRDKGIESIFRQELPEVTLLGANHAKRLKKTFPNVLFTYIHPKPSSIGEVIANHIINAKRYADKEINL